MNRKGFYRDIWSGFGLALGLALILALNSAVAALSSDQVTRADYERALGLHE